MFLLTILGLEACRTASRKKPYVLFCMPALRQSRLWSQKSKQNALCSSQSCSGLFLMQNPSMVQDSQWPSGFALKISRATFSASNSNHVTPVD